MTSYPYLFFTKNKILKRNFSVTKIRFSLYNKKVICTFYITNREMEKSTLIAIKKRGFLSLIGAEK
ncbi:hypothetical protein QFZ72_004304 [Bacillus sp. V2I10]|nr:hypothetical protein [Bacillus sp. V2I10]